MSDAAQNLAKPVLPQLEIVRPDYPIEASRSRRLKEASLLRLRLVKVRCEVCGRRVRGARCVRLFSISSILSAETFVQRKYESMSCRKIGLSWCSIFGT